MYYSILDEKRREMLSKLSTWKDRYVLAGGTALALQINHRDSVDFDFFTESEIDTKKLYEEIKKVFLGQKISKIQEAENTLSVVIDDEVQLSFMSYPYGLIKDPVEDKYLRLASLEDIGCMKLSAITGRSSMKDYVDIYYILHQITLRELLELAQEKFSDLNINIVLKSLVYFGDIEEEPILFQEGKEVLRDEIERFLKEEVREYD